MALVSADVRVALSGAVSKAIIGTALPADASTALVVAYKDVGYISEDGVTESRERSTSDIKAWQGGAIVRTLVTDGKITWKFTMIETNIRSVETYYGAAVAATSILIVPTATGGRFVWALDVIDGAALSRVVIPQGEITEVGDLQYTSSGDPLGYEVTLTGYPDATLGATAKKYFSALAA